MPTYDCGLKICSNKKQYINQLFCSKHWGQLPKDLQEMVSVEIMKDPGGVGHYEAIKATIKFFHKRNPEGMK